MTLSKEHILHCFTQRPIEVSLTIKSTDELRNTLKDAIKLEDDELRYIYPILEKENEG